MEGEKWAKWQALKVPTPLQIVHANSAACQWSMVHTDDRCVLTSSELSWHVWRVVAEYDTRQAADEVEAHIRAMEIEVHFRGV